MPFLEVVGCGQGKMKEVMAFLNKKKHILLDFCGTLVLSSILSVYLSESSLS